MSTKVIVIRSLSHTAVDRGPDLVSRRGAPPVETLITHFHAQTKNWEVKVLPSVGTLGPKKGSRLACADLATARSETCTSTFRQDRDTVTLAIKLTLRIVGLDRALC